MTPASMLPVEPEDKVLDLCAAPGGKATQLASRLGREGLLVANDSSSSRAKGLLKNLELAGFPNILVTSESPERLAGYFPEYFDKILVDAPCSGEGMFRKEPSMRKSWEERGPEAYVPVQREILRWAARMLRPGGMLLYSTCTFDPEENEGSVQYLLEAEEHFSVAAPSPAQRQAYLEAGFCPGMPGLIENGMPELSNCFRIYPHRVKGEGHFLALLKKDGKREGPLNCETAAADTGKKKNMRGKPGKQGQPIGDGKTELAPLWDFLGQVQAIAFKDGREKISREVPIWEEPFYEPRLIEGRAYLIPAGLPSLKGLRCLRTGCYLGELRNHRFEPSQALAMALKKEHWPLTVDLSAGDGRVERYLKGETPDLAGFEGPNGWYLFCADGFSLGWCKLVNGSFRNKYYSGWRW